jgi:hypothetical protein
MRDQDYLTIIRKLLKVRGKDFIKTVLTEMMDQDYLNIIR